MLENDKMIKSSCSKIYVFEYILDKKIIIERKKKDYIIKKLEDYKFPRLANKVNAEDRLKSYDYLTEMSLFSLTFEKIEELKQKYEERRIELEIYMNTSIQDLWKNELNEFMNEYKKWLKSRVDEDELEESKPKKRTRRKKIKVEIK